MDLKPYRRNVFLRDEYSCVYCGQKFSPNELTLDHVIPQAMGKVPHKESRPFQLSSTKSLLHVRT